MSGMLVYGNAWAVENVYAAKVVNQTDQKGNKIDKFEINAFRFEKNGSSLFQKALRKLWIFLSSPLPR